MNRGKVTRAFSDQINIFGLHRKKYHDRVKVYLRDSFDNHTIKVVACSGCSTGPKQCEIKCPDKYMIMDDPTRNVEYNGKNILNN